MDLYRSYCCSFVNSQHITYYNVIRCNTVYSCNFSIHTHRERERYEKIQTIHIIGGCFSLNHPPTNLTLEKFSRNSCTCLARCLNIACVLCFLPQPGPRWRFSKVSSNSWHRVFLNEANGKSIFVLDILDQPLHIYTIPCICVMYKNHQVLESGHHHNVHGRHHIYDDKSTTIRRLSH